MHVAAPAFAHSSGPRDAKIAIVGEGWGEQEALAGKPFLGYGGQELTRMLTEAGIVRKECFLTNVLALRIKEIAGVCVKKGECGPDYALPHLGKAGQYLDPQYLPELERLREELEVVRPNMIVALGATACWALLGTNGLRSLRGTVATGSLVARKVLPTYHPSGLIRDWANRPIAVADLIKARKESEFPEVRRPQRFILVNPTIAECHDWIVQHVHDECACDIETKFGMIEMVGFSAGPQHAMVVPFWDRAKGGNYWPSPNIEKDARGVVRSILENPRVVKVFQNGLFDIQYLIKEGYRPRACREDTMLLHHALYPELQKGLGFLGSIYCNEPAWKLMRGKKITEFKKDD